MDSLSIILNIITDCFKQGLPYAMLALGIFISYRLLDFADLSTEGTFALGGTVVAVLLNVGLPPVLAMLLAICAGFLAGMFTGVLHVKLKIPGLLSGIITMTALFSINMIIMGIAKAGGYDSVVYIKDINTIYDSFLAFFSTPKYNFILISLMIVLAALGMIYWFFGTEVGMSIRATGMNQHMARAQGIHTSWMIILGLAISNALIATGGAMFTQISGSATSTMGAGTLVIGLCAIIVGEAIFGKRSFKNWILSVVLGCLAYFLIISIALQLGLPHYYQNLLQAMLILMVLIFALIKKRVQHINRKHSIEVNHHA